MAYIFANKKDRLFSISHTVEQLLTKLTKVLERQKDHFWRGRGSGLWQRIDLEKLKVENFEGRVGVK